MAGEKQPNRDPQELRIHSPQTFIERLKAREEHSALCVGLDPVRSNFIDIPQNLIGAVIVSQTTEIIDLTAEYANCFKPNSAFFEQFGEEGYRALKNTIDYIKANYPEIPVILDVKRGDVFHTNEAYAQTAFDVLGADAVTVNPYSGSLEPFLERKDKGVFIVCKTSDEQGGIIQDLPIDLIDAPEIYREPFGDLNELVTITGQLQAPLYQVVAFVASRHWNKNNNIGVVVGANNPEAVRITRQIVGQNIPILMPGVGAQGADLETAVQAGVNNQGGGILVASSRNIEQNAEDMYNAINESRRG